MNELRGLWRGKDVDFDVWDVGRFSGYFLNSQGKFAPHILRSDNNDLEEVVPETMGECTCSFDKNGTHIFEGDVVKVYDDLGVVCFGEYSAVNDNSFHIGFYIKWFEKDYASLYRNDLGYWAKYVEVVGNIHDNPELIKPTGGH